MIVIGLLAHLVFVAGVEPSVAVAAATPAPAPKAEILGLWKGTSTCTKVEINEFCRDETVVYNFIDVPDQPATVELKAAQIIDKSVKPVYWLYVTYRPEEGRWTSKFERPQVKGTWAFTIHGNEMSGTATVVPSLVVVRNVEAKRVSKDEALAP